MVVIQIKSGEVDTFLYENFCDTSNDTVVRDIVKIWNLRLRLQQLIGGIGELALYGPMKPPDKAGIDKVYLHNYTVSLICKLHSYSIKHSYLDPRRLQRGFR